jgi:Mn-dependent DtxR family transcriptional regulator
MPHETFDNVERTMLKTLQRNDRASLSEVAAMLPAEGKARLEAARAKLERQELVEPVPGSTTGQMQLTARGAEMANDLGPADTTSGSGGGDSKFA